MNIEILQNMEDGHLIRTLESGALSDTEKLLIERLNNYLNLMRVHTPQWDLADLVSQMEIVWLFINRKTIPRFVDEVERLGSIGKHNYDELIDATAEVIEDLKFLIDNQRLVEYQTF